MIIKLITPPSGEPITLAQARLQCRIDSDLTDDDSLLTGIIIPQVREQIESRSGRALLTQTWLLQLDKFPDARAAVALPKPPVQSVAFVKYVDANGTLQTWSSANYIFQADEDAATITPAFGVDWPAIREQAGAVQIQFVSGYSDDDSKVPLRAKQLMLLLVAHFYNNREAVVVDNRIAANELPLAYETLMQSLCPGSRFL